jgi:hypothetical protein
MALCFVWHSAHWGRLERWTLLTDKDLPVVVNVHRVTKHSKPL